MCDGISTCADEYNGEEGRDSKINFGNSGGDAGDADEYNGEEKVAGGLGHLNHVSMGGRWVPDYRIDPYRAPREEEGEGRSFESERSYSPYSDGENSWGKTFRSSDDLPAWTRRKGLGGNPNPNHDGAYYNEQVGPVPGNRQRAHHSWLKARTEELDAVDAPMMVHGAGGAGAASVDTDWFSSAQTAGAEAAEASAQAASEASAASMSAGRVEPMLKTLGGSSRGLFGGITGSASEGDGGDSDNLWGSQYDAEDAFPRT